MSTKFSALIDLGKEFATGMNKRKLTVFATSGCYYLFMSLVPIVMIICCILPYTPYNLAAVLDYIDHYFTKSLADIMRNIASAIYTSSSTTLTVSILLTLYSASASMKALMKGMDSAYEFECHNNIIWFTLRALFYMVLLVATLLLSLIIMVYGGKILALIKTYFVYVGVLDALLSQTRYLMVMLVLTVVFILLYRVMPSKSVRILDQIPGAIFASVTWVIFSWGFTIYIGFSNKFGAYGFIGTIMVAMLWMHYCLFFLLIGGYMNSFLTAHRVNKTTDILVPDYSEFAPDAQSAIVSESANKKKVTVPLIAAAIICAIAACATALFVKGKKKKAAQAKKNPFEVIMSKILTRKKEDSK